MAAKSAKSEPFGLSCPADRSSLSIGGIMNWIITAFALFSAQAFATTMPMWGNDKVSIIVNGMTDDDAHNLYDAMSTPPKEINGKLSKTFNFDSASGEKTFSLTCVQSKLMANSATCTLIIYVSNVTTVNKGAGAARYDLVSTEAQRLAANFNPPNGVFTRDLTIYQSRDQKLVIALQMAEDGAGVERMIVSYQ